MTNFMVRRAYLIPKQDIFMSLVVGKKVVRLEYEAYTSMATKQLQQLCSDVRTKWPVCKMAVVHRTG